MDWVEATYSAERFGNVTLLQQVSVVVTDDAPNQVGRHDEFLLKKQKRAFSNKKHVCSEVMMGHSKLYVVNTSASNLKCFRDKLMYYY